MSLLVVLLAVVPGCPHLVRCGPHQHVQDLISLVACLEQPLRRLPDLRRSIVPELGGDDLVHREMETWVHRTVAEINFVEAFRERLLELRMLAMDHERSHLRIAEVLDAEVEFGEHLGIRDERPASNVAECLRATRHHAQYDP